MALRRRHRDEPDGVAAAPVVVVVSDDPAATELMVRILRAAGHGWEVERARDQYDLMDRLVDDHVGAVVLDSGSAGGTGKGLKLLDAIRGANEPAISGVPVVFLAASTSTAMFSWQAGVDDLLVRPFHANELVEAVAAAIDRPEDERPKYRRKRLDEARAGGRRVSS